MKGRPKVSVVVVNHNTRAQLRRCLLSIEDRHEVIVVDNASTDGSAEMVRKEFPKAIVIENEENLGFGAANNIGMEQAQGELVLFLNSDAYAEQGAIDRLANGFTDASVVAAGGRLLNKDGSLQESSTNELTLWTVFCEQTYLERLFPTCPFLSPYWNSRRNARCGQVAQVMGACLMIVPIERFDERFFLYCEDTELCKRLSAKGRILYVPTAHFYHELGSSSSAQRWRAVARYNRGKELYFRIHRGLVAAAACWVMDRFGALLRLVVWSLATAASLGLRKPWRERVGLFARVLTAPVAGPDARPGAKLTPGDAQIALEAARPSGR
ncbi:MAG: glycosyltransferase family 2 protein [Fimbriimonas ginsengisoli]|uniref:Glycosyltransferase family 2 protein n=1 Tax=Fimbriimonas ginsengisoli TaxID=1005039 RepID=A0A931PSW2_FIMGI|nr:glycosyltransferase family 2 protein [Fimbriimonas ginsengisoli]